MGHPVEQTELRPLCLIAPVRSTTETATMSILVDSSFATQLPRVVMSACGESVEILRIEPIARSRNVKVRLRLAGSEVDRAMNAVLRMLPCAEFGRVLAETPGAAFEGIWVPLVTPFRDGRVDLDAAQRLATHLVDNGVHGLVVCGTSGEAATLNEMEQKDLLRAVLDAVGSRCPVLVGISESDTREAVNKASRMQRYGIAGFLVSAPPYIRPSQQGLLLHFQSIAAAADRPIVLYNIPQRTGVNIELDTIKALVDNPRFVAIKECGGNPQTLKRLISETPLKVLSGEDTLTFITLGLGGHGAISAAAHIRPDLYVRMYELVKAGEIERARVIFDTLLPLIRYLFSEPNPAPVKAALALQGWISEELRLPMTPVTDVCKAKLRASLESVNTFRG